MKRVFPRERGFTLIELMIVVAIIGVLSAHAVWVRKYLFHAKPAEVRNALGQMAKDASVSVPGDKAKIAGQNYHDYAGTAGPAGTFMAAGMGDLNGDGVTSTSSLRGEVTGGIVVVSSNFSEIRPEE